MDTADVEAKDTTVLRANDQDFQGLVELSPVALLVIVSDRIVYANAALYRLLGATDPDLVLGKPSLAYVPAECQAGVRECFNKVLASQAPERPGYQTWLRVDGPAIQVEATVVPVRWSGQSGLEVILRDISARTERESHLRQVQNQLKTVTEQVTQFAIFNLDLQGRVASWNPGAHRVFGYTDREVIGNEFASLFTPEDRVAGAPEWEIAQATEKGLAQDERWHLRKGGTRCFLSGLLVAVRDDAGNLTGFTKVAQDYTERQLAQEALRLSEERHRQLAAELEGRVAQRTQHLEQSAETWESFCYSMAHDLRAPLRTISGFAHALLDDYASAMDATAKDYASRMVAAAQRLDEFIQDLLDFGRLAHIDLPLRHIDLSQAIDHVLAELHQEIASAQAQVQVQRPLVPVWANPAALEQVITNLTSNALKFVAPGAKPQIRFRTEPTHSGVRLWITDKGIGIGPEYRERVFQLFERLHPQSAYPGTGVGLAIVRKAMERMGGTVGLESTLGEGTSFWIELPQPESPPTGVGQ